MSIFVIILVAVSLSMDAFSLSLAYGTLGLKKEDIIKLSTIVGLYHFFMPLLGMVVGSKLFTLIKINPELIVFIIFVFIGTQMIFESFNEEKEVKSMNFIELLLFGLAVSIDSFSIGIGLKAMTNNYLLAVTIFSICSFSFTFFGLILGKKINSWIGKISTIIGGISLILIGIIYLF